MRTATFGNHEGIDSNQKFSANIENFTGQANRRKINNKPGKPLKIPHNHVSDVVSMLIVGMQMYIYIYVYSNNGIHIYLSYIYIYPRSRGPFLKCWFGRDRLTRWAIILKQKMDAFLKKWVSHGFTFQIMRHAQSYAVPDCNASWIIYFLIWSLSASDVHFC